MTTVGIGSLTPASLLDGNPIPTFIVDANHVVTHMNPACATLLGIVAQDVIGVLEPDRRFYGLGRVLLADMVVDACQPHQFAARYGDRCRASDSIAGAYEVQEFFPQIGPAGRWLQFTAAPLRDSQGRIVGAIETLLDISGSKQTEEALVLAQQALSQQLSKAHDQLAQAEKLASIGQLAAGVAHEINNPIGYIFSNFGTLEKYLDSLLKMLDAYEAAEASQATPDTVAGLKALRKQIDLDYLKQDIPALMRESLEGIARVRKIVQDLKDFSHVDARKEWQFVDLRRCIDSTLNVVNNELKYKADVVCDLVDTPEVECRPSQIIQVIMNLLINAAHAIGTQRGTITVRNGRDDDGNTVWLEIEDTGSGIAGEHLPRIFDPFYTTKPVGKGTGLGLSISYGIVQQHHGQITVRTAVGHGTAFRVTLPVVQSAASGDNSFPRP